MQYYPSPSYDPYSDPYANQNRTSTVQRLQEQHRELLRQSEARLIERGMPVRSLTSPYSTYRDEEPLPSVEHGELSIEAPQWWVNLWSDPIWEIFKRPSIK